MPADIDQRIRDSFARQTMLGTIGGQIDSIAAREVILSAPILPGCLQQHGYAHAAVTFALADSAAGYAALTVMPPEAEVLTAEMKINLIAPATGDRLTAIGKVVKPGRRLVIVQADVYADADGTRTHIALAQGTMVPVTT
ncbi:PaaI family thioesterase [Pseudaestuariivita sp.]|uniref:PaaI family thioesterase n=1 Tax=Pseudaestuariivita sp. TaxID=2211669 RepID=UPI00405A1818